VITLLVVWQFVTSLVVSVVCVKGWRLMTDVQDIETLVAQVGTAVATVASDIAALEALIPAAGSGDTLQPADVTQIKTGLQNAVTSLNAAAASMAAVIPPAAPAAPTGGGTE
jgi:hypothetical protein